MVGNKKMSKYDRVIKMLIDEMFLIAGYPYVTYEDILGKEKWFLEYTMTMEQNEQFKKAGIEILRREMKWNIKRAEQEIGWFCLMYGLKLELENNETVS